MIVFVVGMHRSGTSLMASYLHKCAISMGQNLAKAGAGNRHGHFEDRDFLDFHKKIISRNHCNMYMPKKQFRLSAQDTEVAQRLVANKRKMFAHWGCKDPRTTLFLDFWDNIVPDAKYIMLYRDPYQVIDSLFRRKGEYYFYIWPWLAALGWLEYNRRMLDFFDANREKCILININGFNVSHENGRSILENWLNHPLEQDYSSIYSARDISQNVSWITRVYRPLIDVVLRKRIECTYRALEDRSRVCESGVKSRIGNYEYISEKAT